MNFPILRRKIQAIQRDATSEEFQEVSVALPLQ